MTSTGPDRSGYTECVVGLLDHLEHFLAKRRNSRNCLSATTMHRLCLSSTFDSVMKNTFCLRGSGSLGEQTVFIYDSFSYPFPNFSFLEI